MAVYYVDSAAAPGGDGSIGTPWDSLSDVEAHGSFSGGDYIMLKRESLFREDLVIPNGGSFGSPITFGAYGVGADPKISGARLVTGWTQVSGNIWEAADDVAPHIVIFDGTVGNEVASVDQLSGDGDWYWDADVLYTFCNADPDGYYTSPGIEAGERGWGITTDWSSGKNYITIENIHLYGQNTGPAIFGTRTTGWIIHDVTIEKIARTGIQMRAAYDLEIYNCNLQGVRSFLSGDEWRGIYCYAESASYPGGNIRIHNNDINYWSNYAIEITGPDDSAHPVSDAYAYDNDCSHSLTGVYFIVVDGGEIYGNTCDDNLRGTNGSGEEYGIAITSARNLDVHHNTCTNGRVGCEIWGWNYSDPWTGNGPADGNKVHHNDFSGNSEHGLIIDTGCCDDTEIYTNLFYNNGWGGVKINESTVASTGCSVMNNTIYNNALTETAYGNIHFSSDCPGWVVKNNIAFAVAGYAFRCVHSGGFQGTHDYNLYWKSSGNIVDDMGTYYTAAQISSWEANGIAEDPDFVSTSAGSEDFHLQASSPAIDTAEEVGLTTDYDDNPKPV